MSIAHTFATVLTAVFVVGAFAATPTVGATTADATVESADARSQSVGAPAQVSDGTNESTLPPIDGNTPTDPNGDGLYEDLNGNERWDYNDVVTYYQYREDPVLTDHVWAYDYNDNDRVDYNDLVMLYQQQYDAGDQNTSDPVDFGDRDVYCEGNCTADGTKLHLSPDGERIDPTSPDVGPVASGDETDVTVDLKPAEPASGNHVVDARGNGDYATIQAAVDAADDGDTILVRNGTYRERVVVNESVRLIGQSATVDGADFENESTALTVTESATIRGFTIRNYSQGIANGTAVESVTVESVAIRGSGYGVVAEGSGADWRLSNVSVTGGYAIDAAGSSGNWSISNATIDEGYGVGAAESSGNWSISNVSFEEGYGIGAADSSGDWSVSNVTLRRASGVRASGSSGDWRVADLHAINGSGIYASGAEGRWTVSRLTATRGDGVNGIYASDTTGEWSVSHVRVDVGGASNGIYAVDAAGDWDVANVSMELGGASNGVYAIDVPGDWDVANVSMELGDASNGVYGTGSGDWTVSNARLTLGHGSNAVSGSGTSGNWSVSRTAMTLDGDSNAVDAYGATGEWTVSDVSVRTDGGNGFLVPDVSNEWTVRNVSVMAGGGIGVLAGGTANWRVKDVAVRNASTGVYASGASGPWNVSDVAVTNATTGVRGAGATGNWSVRDVAITDVSEYGVHVVDGSGTWRISNVSVRDAAGAGIEATDHGGRLALADVRVTNASTGVTSRGSGQTSVERSVFRDSEVGLEVRETAETASSDHDAVVRDASFRDNEVAVLAGSNATVDVTASEFAGSGEAVNATSPDATVNASGNWWGETATPADRVAGDVTTAGACEGPCKSESTVRSGASGPAATTAGLPAPALATWGVELPGGTANATLEFEYAANATGDGAAVVVAVETSNGAREWTLPADTDGTVEQRLTTRVGGDEAVTVRAVSADATVSDLVVD